MDVHEGLGLQVRQNPRMSKTSGLKIVQMQGIHLIRHSIYRTLELGGQIVLLGSGHADGDFR